MEFILLLSNCLFVFSLTCNEILEFPEDRKITLDDLQTLQHKETVQCLAHLGKEQLEKEEAKFIWQSIVSFYGSAAEVPDEALMLLHWVTPALMPEDYSNLTLSNIDIIQNFGLNYDLNEDQLSAIARRVRLDFAGKEPEDYTYYDLSALKQILCAFNQSEIERIHPSAYKEAALMIGKLENCKPDVFRGFATLAVQPRAFGSPADWSPATFEALGEVAHFIISREVPSRYLATQN